MIDEINYRLESIKSIQNVAKEISKKADKIEAIIISYCVENTVSSFKCGNLHHCIGLVELQKKQLMKRLETNDNFCE